MRFLIAPNFALAYDQRMVRSLARALHHLGHEAKALSAPIEDFALADVCRAYDPDVVIRVNRFRPLDNPLPPKVRHIAWFQDVFPETLANIDERIAENDIVYVLGDPETLGFNVRLPCFVGTLLCGVDETMRPTEAVGLPIDASLCGYIPPPVYRNPRIALDLIWYYALPVLKPFERIGFSPTSLITRICNIVPYALTTSLIGVVEANYQPLCGNLDIHRLTAAMNEIAATHFGYKQPAGPPKVIKSRLRRKIYANVMAPYIGSNSEGLGRWGTLQRLMSYLARDYPRLLDRVALIEGILSVSNSLELYGPGWSEHPQFRQYYKGTLDSSADLANVFGRSRLNLANNTHGLGLHSRTLECMAVGGFIFTHSSPADGKPGGMRTAFEPDVHYGLFTPDTLEEDARRWLRDEAKRQQAGAKASAIVRQDHTWTKRAQQILADLRR